MVVQEALSLLTKVSFPRPEQAPTGSQPGQDGASSARGRDWLEDGAVGGREAMRGRMRKVAIIVNFVNQSSGPPPTLSVTHLSSFP